jgi:hypothetical protein
LPFRQSSVSPLPLLRLAAAFRGPRKERAAR